jgi:hypothetical protein
VTVKNETYINDVNDTVIGSPSFSRVQSSYININQVEYLICCNKADRDQKINGMWWYPCLSADQVELDDEDLRFDSKGRIQTYPIRFCSHYRFMRFIKDAT